MKVLRFTLLTQIDSICIFSRIAHYHMHTIYAHVWTAFILFPVKKRFVAVTEHHVAASNWAAMLAWYNASGPAET